MAGRVFLRGIEGEKYDLKNQRQERLAASRVVAPEERSWRDEKATGHEDSSPQSRAKWILGPGDDPFLTQTIQVHFVQIDPGGSNGGHGHQNEAAFYILDGHGYEIHDGRRYDWSAGDLVIVHNDSRHQHFNADPERPALALVFKAKALWMFLGLTQQGKRGSIPEGAEGDFGEAEDWSPLWTKGVEELDKIIHSSRQPWEGGPGGAVKWLARGGSDARLFSLDIWLQRVSGRTERHWHMADEVFYVLEGSGHTDEWQVEAEITDRYRARVAKRPRRLDWKQGDLVYVAQNTIHEHVADGDALLLCAKNRLFAFLGYDATVPRPADEPVHSALV
ncbi:MAG TPA: cupin domain-containing protein [Candidatus Dormibacteraeota bacterium]